MARVTDVAHGTVLGRFATSVSVADAATLIVGCRSGRTCAHGTFDELLASVEPDLAAIARRLRAIIRAVDVSTVETVRLGDNAATYGVGPKKMTDGYTCIMPKRGYINLGFYQGAVPLHFEWRPTVVVGGSAATHRPAAYQSRRRTSIPVLSNAAAKTFGSEPK